MNQFEELLSALQKISAKLRDLKEDEIKNIKLHDFSFSYFRYIENIYKLNSPTFIELAKEMKLSKPTVTIMVNKLIEGGYVNKDKSVEDGRVYHLSLTAKSNKIIETHNNMYKKFAADISNKFTDTELKTLITLLKQL